MSLFSESFLLELENLGWFIDKKRSCVGTGWHFRNRYIQCAAVEDEDEEAVRVEYEYVSRYTETPRSRLLLKACKQQSTQTVVYVHPNKLITTQRFAVLDSDGDEIKPDDFDEYVGNHAQQFFEIVCAYEVCARITDPDTRDVELYRKVLPTRQAMMIATNTLSS